MSLVCKYKSGKIQFLLLTVYVENHDTYIKNTNIEPLLHILETEDIDKKRRATRLSFCENMRFSC